MTKHWCFWRWFKSPYSHWHVSFFLKDYSFDKANAIVSIPVPASPSISERMSTQPAAPSGQAFIFIDNLFDFYEDVSVRQKLDIIIENQKPLFKLSSDFIQQSRDSVCHCQCKAGRDQIRIGGRESLGVSSTQARKQILFNWRQ